MMRWRNALVMLMLAAALQAMVSLPAKAQIAVIVHRSNNIGDLPLAEVRKFLMGDKTTWRNNKHVVVLMSEAGTPEREIILREVYKMNEEEFARFSLQIAFTGHAQPPRNVAAAEMKRIVAETPGAIGYVPIAEVDDSVRAVLLLR
jgi:ABC-type phosphate transport system substrate-binding protein